MQEGEKPSRSAQNTAQGAKRTRKTETREAAATQRTGTKTINTAATPETQTGDVRRGIEKTEGNIKLTLKDLKSRQKYRTMKQRKSS